MSVNICLVTTDHLKDRLWFKDDDDFKVGMNYVAVLAATTPVQVFAFVLMSNHVHFVLGRAYEDVVDFITRFKQAYSNYFNRKYSSKELLRNNSVNIQKLTVGNESFERAVAYVHMNPVAANICSHPAGYTWGTGSLLFNRISSNGSRIGTFSKRAQAKIVHSRILLPSDYIVDEKGFISPLSYVQIQFVESVFRTPSRMNYFLQNSSKSLNSKKQNLPTFKDQIVFSAMEDLCSSLFNKNNHSELNQIQKTELVKQIKRRFSADPHQISRVTGIPYETILQMLDTF
ncbi:MAG: transposase [Bacteroidales bacterium]|nr:transposase [Bacteroidales bacterium]